MPAYFDTGFSVREPMWHGEGTVLDDYPDDWDDARLKAGLLWEPKPVTSYSLRPLTEIKCASCEAHYTKPHADECALRTESSVLVDEISCGYSEPLYKVNDTDVMCPSRKSKLIVRDDTLAELGSVGIDFTLVQHSEMGEIIEAILGAGAKFETAGSCKDGAQVWALAYLDEPEEIAGDDSATLPFLALLNSHDGSGACKLTMTSIRVVCWNTYNAASMEGAKHGRQFIFRHSKNVHERIDEAKDALKGLRHEAAEWRELAESLVKVRADDAALQMFVQTFIPEPAADVVSPRVRNNIDRARSTFTTLYNESPTVDGHRGTLLGLVDASVEYLDHVRTFRNRDTYMGRTLLRPEPMKAQALKLAREACGVS